MSLLYSPPDSAFNYSTQLPDIHQFWALFQTTGWNDNYHLTSGEYLQALKASWYTLSAYERDRLIGFGRLVSDGVVHAMIYDLIVLPEYQGRGIGTHILNVLVERCQEAKIRDIQLFSARGKHAFYEKRGFFVRPDDAPGMQFKR